MGWLVLTRKRGESIRIGDDIEVAISKVDKHGHVSLAVNAPRDVRVLRSEVADRDGAAGPQKAAA